MLRKALDFFLSLRTALWLLIALLCVFLYGSFVMPSKAEFQDINAVPLFKWLGQNPPSATWWLWGAIGLLSLLAANTIFCSIESLIKKRRGRHWLLVISPQIVHAGFLFLLLAHLLSSVGGSKSGAVAHEGATLMLPNGLLFRVNALNVDVGAQGHIRNWRAEVEYFAGGQKLKTDYLAPNRPSFYKGLGVYLKDAQAYPVKACLLEISREPGAPWALAGGIIFAVGTLALFALKSIREEGQGPPP